MLLFMFIFKLDIKFIKDTEVQQAAKDTLSLFFHPCFYTLKNKMTMTNMYVRLKYVHKMEVIMLS